MSFNRCVGTQAVAYTSHELLFRVETEPARDPHHRGESQMCAGERSQTHRALCESNYGTAWKQQNDRNRNGSVVARGWG